MIRVEITGQPSAGIFEYWVVEPIGRERLPSAVHGRSSSPLLDTCRQLKRMGGDPRSIVGLFWPGSSDWAARCSIGWGAGHSVKDKPGGGGPTFVKYQPFRALPLAEADEADVA